MSEHMNQNTSRNCDDEIADKQAKPKNSEKASSPKATSLIEAEGLAYTVNEDGISCTVTGIGTCKKKKLFIPSGIDGYAVTDIGENAFRGRKNLLSVSIPDGVTNIRDNAFCGCANIKSLQLPSSVKYIGAGAFKNCAPLLAVSYNGTQEAWSRIHAVPDWFEGTSAEFSFIDSTECRHIPETISAILPTCTTSGHTEGQRCSLCGEILQAPSPIANTGHRFGEWSTVKEVSCLEDGLEERICDCGAKETRTVKSPGKHNFSAWRLVKDVTCTEVGVCERTCSCGAKESLEIEARGHRFGEWSLAKEATCTEDGLEERVCTCGAKETRSIEALGHHFGDWTLAKEATCTENGLKERVCTCGAKETRSIEALGHHFGDWTLAKEPTCTEDGLEERVCTCGAKETRSIEALGHRFGEWTLAKKATCAGDGLEERLCTCGAKETRSVPFKGEHTPSGWIIIKEATAQDSGLREIRCLICGEKLREEILPPVSVKFDYVVVPNTKSCKITGLHFCTQKSLTVPAQLDGYTVTEICSGAFDFCENLHAVIIPDSVTHIGESAFEGCTSLSAVTVPDSVKEIGPRAFYGCENLADISIPQSVERIGDYAFTNCGLLSEIILPSSLASIGKKAFYGCRKLTNTVIPISVKHIGYRAFGGCTKLSSVVYKGDREQWGKMDTDPEWTTNPEIHILFEKVKEEQKEEPISEKPKSETAAPLSSTGITYSVNSDGKTCTITGIGSCQSKKILLPWTIDGYTVTAVGDKAFCGCKTVSEITVWGSVTSVGNEAFRDCTGLLRVNIGNGVKSIGNMAFYGCDRLSKILIPTSVVRIGKMAFACGIKSIGVANENPAFSSVNGNLYSKDRKTLLQYAGGKEETDIRTEPSVTVIGDFAFSGCTSVSRVILSDSVTDIGEGAFYGCERLTSLSLGNSLTSLGAFAFGGCPEISYLVIPKSIQVIGDCAFDGCTKLSEIQFNGTQAQWNAISLSEKWMENSSVRSVKFHAPMPTLPGSKPAAGSGKLAYICYRDNKNCAVTGIGDCNVSDLVIPKTIDGYTVRIILFYAFQNLTRLTSVEIPEGVTEIRNSAFKNCTSLQRAVIPASVEKIEASVFEGCSGLSEITYLGTKEQWQRIRLHPNWNRKSNIEKIRCSDS